MILSEKKLPHPTILTAALQQKTFKKGAGEAILMILI